MTDEPASPCWFVMSSGKMTAREEESMSSGSCSIDGSVVRRRILSVSIISIQSHLGLERFVSLESDMNWQVYRKVWKISWPGTPYHVSEFILEWRGDRGAAFFYTAS